MKPMTYSTTFPAEGFKLKKELAALERSLILHALSCTDDNCNQAADLLGINRTTLVEKRKKLGLPLKFQRKP